MNLKRMLDAASILLETQGRLADVEKRGTLRGGSCGWLNEDCSEGAGTCPRRALARKWGLGLEDNSSKQPMFQAGHLSEEGLLQLLKLVWPGGILREEEVPITWETSNGTFVTGRPDLVLTRDDVPVMGLEAKLVSSLWTALEILREPKTIHAIQAAHYSKKLGIPWQIIYVNRTNWALLSDFALGKVPKEGEPGSEFVEYVERKKKIKDKHTGEERQIKFREGKAMLPFHHVYPMRWNPEDRDELQIEMGGQWESSFITWSGIERFYEFTSTMEDKGLLGPVPTAVTVLGDSKGYSECKYCPLETICKNKKLSLDMFRESCESLSNAVGAKHSAMLAELQNNLLGGNEDGV